MKYIDWKLLYLGATQHRWPNKMNVFNISDKVGFYYPDGTADGAFSVIIHSSIYDELLEEINIGDNPFDSGALQTIQKRYSDQCICIFPYIIIADVRESDCRAGRNQAAFSKKCCWDLSLFTV